ncbi:MAG TPA: filamentous hemagglutinin N-terminal domain-containing protein [Pseudomonadales bacterium]
MAIAVASFGAFPAVADTTLPTGGSVSAGSASIGTAGAAMTINQASQRAVIRWNSFSIGSDASVTFNQPNSASITLNRVLGNDLSRIDGQLNANGQVFITNPNGVLFGAGSQVNVGGLVASTLDMDEAGFMAGNYVLAGQSPNAVISEGDLTGANVALVGARVINEGNITASGGSVQLLAGERITLGFDGDGLLLASVDVKTLAALVHNGGVIDVGNGRLLMTTGASEALGMTLVNNSGVVRATSLSGEGGEIVLAGDAVVSTGTLDASGTTPGSVSLTGNVVVAATADMQGDVSVTAAIAVDPDNIDPLQLAADIEAYAGDNLPAIAALIDSGAIDLVKVVETLQATDLAALLDGSMSEAELASTFNTLIHSGGIDLTVLAEQFDSQAMAGLLRQAPGDNEWLQTAARILEANAINPQAIVPLLDGHLLASVMSGHFEMADAVNFFGRLLEADAININAIAGAFTPEQMGSLVGLMVGPDMAPMVSNLITSGTLDLDKALSSLSPEQWQGLMDGSINQTGLFTALIGSGAINLNTAAGRSLLNSFFGGVSPIAPPKPASTKLSTQERMKLMRAKMQERMKAMREKMRQRMAAMRAKRRG